MDIRNMNEEKEKKGRFIMPGLMIALEARDARGKLLKRIRTPANSWLDNFYELLEMLFAPHLTTAYFTPYGEAASIQHRAFPGGSVGNTWDNPTLAGKSQIGVGNSDAAFQTLQSKLQGSTVYWADMSDYDESTTKATFKATIACANALTVKEVGLRWNNCVVDKNGSVNTVMIERTVLADADRVDIPAGGSAAVTYEMALP